MYVATAGLKIATNDSFDKVYQIIQEVVRKTREEKGCVHFSIHPLNKETGEFILWEQFENKAALDFHMQTPYTKEYFDKGYTTVQWIHQSDVSNF